VLFAYVFCLQFGLVFCLNEAIKERKKKNFEKLRLVEKTKPILFLGGRVVNFFNYVFVPLCTQSASISNENWRIFEKDIRSRFFLHQDFQFF